MVIANLAERLTHRIQLTTDGHAAYLDAVEGAFKYDIDYAMLIKLYGQEPAKEARYSPAVCIGANAKVVEGNPDRNLISTSYVERQNLTMRMQMRRFTRLTNAFSKKVENLACALALHFMHYNFCRESRLVSRGDRRPASKLTHYPWPGGCLRAAILSP